MVLYAVYVFDNIELSLSPSIFYGVSFSEDKHIKRDFYTKSKYKNIGYKSHIGIGYNISPRFFIFLNHDYFYFKDDKSQMDYFENKKFKYMSLPSSMRYDENSLSIGMKYKF
jgi:opacity protein-like surface antigen